MTTATTRLSDGFEIAFELSESRRARALGRHLRRRIAPIVIVVVGGLGAFAYLFQLIPECAPLAPYLFALAVVIFGTTALSYRTTIVAGRRLRESMQTRVTVFHFATDSLKWSNELTEVRMSWRVFSALVRTDDVFLLMDHDQNIAGILPAECLSEEIADFILARIRAARSESRKCLNCGYDLRGSASDRCSECGTWIVPRAQSIECPNEAPK